MKKRLAVIGIVFLLLLLILAGVMDGIFPVLLGEELPESYEQSVLGQAAGPYSRKLPLAPVLVWVDGVSAETVYYTIFYFPFGSVGMSYNRSDGYNIEKPLSRL